MPGKDRFRQVDTLFNVRGIDHDGALYLGHTGAVSAVWQDLASRTRALGVPAVRARGAASTAPVSRATALSAKLTKARQAKSRPQMRALLVGIADYQDQSNNLEGPVNDVFNMSATLQELGFDADDIRIVLNDRATAAGIRERLKWLLADPRDGDQRVFFFAGHGAQIPGYGSSAEVDRLDECLVPYDFDWGQGRAITDDEFAALYSQLPYGTQFTAVLDCCHSGGIARAGGVRPRGITPPDDIRHRSICWDKETQMWLPRERFEKKKIGAKQGATGRGVKRAADRQAWVGESGAVQRLGRGTSLWLPSDSAYRRARKRNGHAGPYTPILLEACAEGELAYEYRHGVVSHGAFTFALCGALRAGVELGQRVAHLLEELAHPRVLGARQDHVHGKFQVAGGRARQALAPHAQGRAGLRAGGHAHLQLVAIRQPHRHDGAERRFPWRHRQLGQQIGAAQREAWMRADPDLQIEIPFGGAAQPGQADALSGPDTGGDPDVDRAASRRKPPARIDGGQFDLDLARAAAPRFVEFQFDRRVGIVAGRSRIAGEEAGEEGVERAVLEAATPGAEGRFAAGRRRVRPRVVGGTLFRIGQHRVGLVHRLHARAGVRSLAEVGVVLARELAERLLDLVGRGVARYTEHAVVVVGGHGRTLPLAPAHGDAGRPLQGP